MTKVIVINGYPESGKDVFVEMCRELYPNSYNLHASDPAKDALVEVGWDGEKTPEARQTLSMMVSMSWKYGVVLKYVRDMVLRSRKDSIIFVHCREYENVCTLKREFNALTLFIDRASTYINIDDELSSKADREAGQYKELYDCTITNNAAMDSLRKEAELFMKAILEGAQDANIQ